MSNALLKKYKHALYEQSVQGVDCDLDFIERVFHRNHPTQSLRKVREDFCGTAQLACTWVERHEKNHAIGVDLEPSVLKCAEANRAMLSPSEQKRISLFCADVRNCDTPLSDAILALNFSFCCFKTREALRAYFEHARTGLNEKGMLVLDIYGGTESVQAKKEPKLVPAFTALDGTEFPEFEYIWDQASYNVITHETTTHIHFEVPGWGELTRAFSYDWRLWGLPELNELLLEAGFERVDFYMHGWTDEGVSDGVFRLRKNYENAEGWIAYIVARQK